MTILPQNVRDWPDIWRDRYEERAAVLQYEAKFTRYVAEKLAEQDTRRVAEKS